MSSIGNPALDEFQRLPDTDAYHYLLPWEDPDMPPELAAEVKEVLGALEGLGITLDKELMVPKPNPAHYQFAQRYSWGIPNDEALDLLAEHAPLVEIGAGVGYWAHLLRQRGVDIVAYDRAVRDGVNTSGWHTAEDNSHYPLWTGVSRGTQTALKYHPDRTLFLCWPPNDSPMARYCLQHYLGNTVVYVGENDQVRLAAFGRLGPPGKGCNADESFFKLLREEFVLERTVDIPHWNLLHDRMEVWKRKGSY